MILSYLFPTDRLRSRGTPLYFELASKAHCVSTSAHGRLLKVPQHSNGCVRAAFFDCTYEQEDSWLVQLIQGDLLSHVNTAKSFAEAKALLPAPSLAIYSDVDLLAQAGSELSIAEATTLTKMQGYLVKVDTLKAFILPTLPSGWGLLTSLPNLLGCRQSCGDTTALVLTDPREHIVVIKPS